MKMRILLAIAASFAALFYTASAFLASFAQPVYQCLLQALTLQ